MPEERLRVFVSGTQDDLGPEREALAQALEGLGLEVIRAEAWRSSWASPREVLREMVHVSDLYIGLYGRRYGYVLDPDGISATEFEFLEARQVGKPILVYVKGLQEGERRDPQQEAFLERVLDFNTGVFRRPEFQKVQELEDWARQDVAELIGRLVREKAPAVPAPFTVPADLSHFVGREEEIARIKSYFGSESHPRPIAIYGMGGAGKTALSIHYAHRHREQHPGGVLWADLSRSTLGTILFGFAQALGESVRFEAIQDEGRQIAFVGALLEAHRPLVILDDPQDDELLSKVLLTAIGCPLLVTTRSRAFPSLSDAVEIEIEGLGIQPSLKVLNAAVGADRVAEERISAEDICRSVGGLPLGLKLVGRRAALSQLSLSQMAERLRAGSVNEVRYGSAVSKETDLRKSFEISFSHLPPSRASIFTSLGVFAGIDFDTQAAAWVADAPLEQTREHLAALHEMSLVQRGRDRRWRLHPLLRDYALAQAPEEAAERMVRYFRDFVEEAAPRSEGPGDTEWAGRMHLEYENILAALSRSLDEGLVDNACALAGKMFWFWSRHGRLREGLEWLERVLADPGVQEHGASADVFFAAGALSWALGRHAKASQHLRKSLESNHLNRSVAAYTLTFLSLVNSSQGDVAAARESAERSLTLWREEQDDKGLAYSLSYLGWAAECRGDWRAARQLFDDAMPVAERADLRRSVAWSLIGQGRGDQGLQQFSSAAARFEKAIEIARQVTDDWSLAWALAGLGSVHVRRGAYQRGVDLLEQALLICTDLGDNWGSGLAHCGLGRRWRCLGQDGKAADSYRLATERGMVAGAILVILEALAGLAASLGSLGHQSLAATTVDAFHAVHNGAGVELTPDLEADLACLLSPREAGAASPGSVGFGDLLTELLEETALLLERDE
jgi:tetratricopeptide (TPR) repeat protein